MLTIYDTRGQGLVRREDIGTCEHAVWIDLLNPGKEEERFVEQRFGLQVPTREEMAEIEASSRLYQESGAHFMTATVLHQTDTPDPQITTITFILTENRLLTVRYAEPKAFSLFLGRAAKQDAVCDTAMAVLLGLLEAIIDREADLIERLQAETEKIAHTIFEIKGGGATRSRRFDVILKQIGKEGVITSKARDSLLSLGRLLTYLAQVALLRKENETVRERMRTASQDVQSLSDHLSYLNARINFMLDASLGMVSIEQNEIIKVFSIAAVMLMPPTLVASIYGMNFKFMPELEWVVGYPLALGSMVVSALLPFLYFRRKGWL
jgi:magnesium transporter